MVLTAVLISCNGRIEPTPPLISPTGFSGKISFIGDWPAGIKRTHLVAFKNPIRDVTDFFPPNLSIILDSIAYGTREFDYDSAINSFVDDGKIDPGEYAYVVVVQSKTETLSLFREDWTVAGVYYIGSDPSIPAVLKIEQNHTTRGIDIICNFNNPPPQPPGGK